MSESSNLRQSLGPLSVGNVISASLQIYRDRFKVYYLLALQAYLWILIPIYGWAKFASILGLISRLAFSEISEHPETVSEARRHTKPRLWTFLLAGFLSLLIFLGAFLGVGVVLAIVFGFLAAITQKEPSFGIFVIILAIITFIALVFGYIWLYSRLSLVELPIAIEDQEKAGAAIGRSWTLTKGFVLRLQLIFFVAFLVTIPVSIVIQIVSNILQIIFTLLLPQIPEGLTPALSLIYFVLVVAFAFASNALIIPFWQAIKAIIYYDLCSRKEGIDLQLRDSDS